MKRLALLFAALASVVFAAEGPAEATISVSGTSASATLSAGFKTIYCTVAAHYRLTRAASTAVTTDMPVPATQHYTVQIGAANRLAIVTEGATGTCYVYQRNVPPNAFPPTQASIRGVTDPLSLSNLYVGDTASISLVDAGVGIIQGTLNVGGAATVGGDVLCGPVTSTGAVEADGNGTFGLANDTWMTLGTTDTTASISVNGGVALAMPPLSVEGASTFAATLNALVLDGGAFWSHDTLDVDGTSNLAGVNISSTLGVGGNMTCAAIGSFLALDAGAVAAADVYASAGMVTRGTATADNFNSTASLGTLGYNIQPGAYFYSGGSALWDWNQDGGHIDILQPTHFNGSATFGYLVATPTIDAGSVMASSMQITEQNGTIVCGASNVMQEVVRTTDGGTFKFLCDGDGFWNFVSKGLDDRTMGSARSGPSIPRGYVMGGFRPYLPGHSLHLESHVLAAGTGAGYANWTIQKRRSDAGVVNICNAYTSCTAGNHEWPDITPCAGTYDNWSEDVIAVTMGYDGGCTQVPDARLVLTGKRGVETLPAGD